MLLLGIAGNRLECVHHRGAIDPDGYPRIALYLRRFAVSTYAQVMSTRTIPCLSRESLKQRLALDNKYGALDQTEREVVFANQLRIRAKILEDDEELIKLKKTHLPNLLAEHTGDYAVLYTDRPPVIASSAAAAIALQRSGNAGLVVHISERSLESGVYDDTCVKNPARAALAAK
eukprot:TRINITY_DN10757_c0_g1_i1.p2 TRINITY_DN10757_c0_g1~~TRINITY_DN10757_c0_g1_i1.p2  ORF type:complete len:175 (+),score=19.54 TRINITY_DN10757_c0_g1_i1:584-1108(+)